MPDTIFDFTPAELEKINELRNRRWSAYSVQVNGGTGQLFAEYLQNNAERRRPDRGRRVAVYTYILGILESRPLSNNQEYDDLVLWFTEAIRINPGIGSSGDWLRSFTRNGFVAHSQVV